MMRIYLRISIVVLIFTINLCAAETVFLGEETYVRQKWSKHSVIKQKNVIIKEYQYATRITIPKYRKKAFAFANVKVRQNFSMRIGSKLNKKPELMVAFFTFSYMSGLPSYQVTTNAKKNIKITTKLTLENVNTGKTIHISNPKLERLQTLSVTVPFSKGTWEFTYDTDVVVKIHDTDSYANIYVNYSPSVMFNVHYPKLSTLDSTMSCRMVNDNGNYRCFGDKVELRLENVPPDIRKKYDIMIHAQELNQTKKLSRCTHKQPVYSCFSPGNIVFDSLPGWAFVDQKTSNAIPVEFKITIGNVVGAVASNLYIAKKENIKKQNTEWMNRVFDTHLNRTLFTLQPGGELIPVSGASTEFKYNPKGNNNYKDAYGLIWQLVPDEESSYHQPTGGKGIYKKFLLKDSMGGSFEAIVRLDGSYVLSGDAQATYNFSHTDSVFGYINHGLQDVLPHEVQNNGVIKQFIEEYFPTELPKAKYNNHKLLDPNKINVYTFYERYSKQVAVIGTSFWHGQISHVKKILVQTKLNGQNILAVVETDAFGKKLVVVIDHDLKEYARDRAIKKQGKISFVSPNEIHGLTKLDYEDYFKNNQVKSALEKYRIQKKILDEYRKKLQLFQKGSISIDELKKINKEIQHSFLQSQN